jgi:hypothetical protein
MARELRRMLAPWMVEEGESTYVVRTTNGFVVSVTYFDDEPNGDFNLRKEEARRLAVAISRLPELLERARAADVALATIVMQKVTRAKQVTLILPFDCR